MPGSHSAAAVLDAQVFRREVGPFALRVALNAPEINLGNRTGVGGPFQVTGTIKKKGSPTNVPTRARVRLFRDRDGVYVAQAWSDPVTGAYQFLDVAGGHTYTAIAYDHNDIYQAVAGDRLTPVAL